MSDLSALLEAGIKDHEEQHRRRVAEAWRVLYERRQMLSALTSTETLEGAHLTAMIDLYEKVSLLLEDRE